MSPYVEKMKNIKITHTIIIFLISTFITFSKESQIIGTVRNKVDKSPIQSVNIYFKGTNIGAQSDEDGFYMIKNSGDETILVFSCVGYKTQEHKIRKGEISGLYVEMREDISILQELFVLPGANPALDLMQKVRQAKSSNDVINQQVALNIKEEQTVFLIKSKTDNSSQSKHKSIFDDFSLTLDSSKYTPLYISNEEYSSQGNITIKSINKESKEIFENAGVLFEKLMGDLSGNYNFYNNTIVIFGKHFISPIASSANTYYRFFLIDSLNTEQGKQYYLRFKTKNNKNLAFNGELWVDSATYSITKITAELPKQANINFIKKLRLSSNFNKSETGLWIPDMSVLSLNMDYQLLADSITQSPEIYIQKRQKISLDSAFEINNENFAATPFSKEELEFRIAEMNDLPLMKTAKWIADGIITGYVNAGKIDIGKVYSLARLSDVEGFRFSLPIRTNEHLMKNISLGGYWGYGFNDNKHKYSINASFKLPLRKRTLISLGYTDDYRRIDYDYNDFSLRENPLLSGDEDIANTIFAFRSSNKINKRKEFYASLSHDWNKDVESFLFFRNNTYFAGNMLPFTKDANDVNNMLHKSISFTTRFSKDERKLSDHLERIYIQNKKPVLYLTAEGGQTTILSDTYHYLKINSKLKQTIPFDVGEWNYYVDAGWMIGKVPYNLLWIPQGSETLLFKRYHYNLLNYMEYAFDKYITFHNELVFNGIIFNHIPVVKNLNLRELVTFKFLYGDLSAKQNNIIDFPQNTEILNTPYMEVGVGFSNIFRIFSLQSVWRLTDFDKSNVRSWSIIGGIRLNF